MFWRAGAHFISPNYPTFIALFPIRHESARGQKVSAWTSLKRKLDQDFGQENADRKFSTFKFRGHEQDLIQDIHAKVDVLNSTYISNKVDCAASNGAVHALLEHAKNDVGALSHLVDLLKRYKTGGYCQTLSGVIRRAVDAITYLAHENANFKTRGRWQWDDLQVLPEIRNYFTKAISKPVKRTQVSCE